MSVPLMEEPLRDHREELRLHFSHRNGQNEYFVKSPRCYSPSDIQTRFAGSSPHTLVSSSSSSSHRNSPDEAAAPFQVRKNSYSSPEEALILNPTVAKMEFPLHVNCEYFGYFNSTLPMDYPNGGWRMTVPWSIDWLTLLFLYILLGLNLNSKCFI